MLTRRERTILLLGSRLAHADRIRTWTGGLVARSAQRGESPSLKLDCRRCQGEGVLGRKKCVSCAGRGFVVVDSYTRCPVADERTGTVAQDHETRRVRSEVVRRELNVLEANLRLRDGSEAAHDAFTAAVEQGERLYRQGSYWELDRCLEALRDREPLAAHAVMLAHVYEPTLRCYGSVSALAHLAAWGVSFVVLRMPDPIRLPRHLLDNTTAGKAFHERQQKRAA